jgi:hypothetical protein
MQTEEVLPSIERFANVIKNEDPKQIVLIIKETPLWIFTSLLEEYLSPQPRMQLLVDHESFCHFKKAVCTSFCTLPWQTGRLSFRFQEPSQKCYCDHEAYIQALYDGKWYFLDDECRAMSDSNHNGVEIIWEDDFVNEFEVCTMTVLY